MRMIWTNIQVYYVLYIARLESLLIWYLILIAKLYYSSSKIMIYVIILKLSISVELGWVASIVGGACFTAVKETTCWRVTVLLGHAEGEREGRGARQGRSPPLCRAVARVGVQPVTGTVPIQHAAAHPTSIHLYTHSLPVK